MACRTACRRIASAFAACVALAASSGCAHPLLNAIFVNHDKPRYLAVIHLVESPRGHLTGYISFSGIRNDGSKERNVVSNLSGTITGANVSLHVETSSLAHWFQASPNLIGTLRGKTLRLSAGSQTTVYHEMTRRGYEATVAGMDTLARHLAMVAESVKAVHQAMSSGQQLNADLKNYIAWGQKRINGVAGVRQWYANRLKGYTRCLQSIRPLAAAGVPSWRWQNCVLAIENDEYNRGQEVETIRNALSYNQQAITRLDARINATRQHFPKVVGMVREACPYSRNVAACDETARMLKSRLPNGFLDGQTVQQYKSLAPQVTAAMRTDARISDNAESSLSALARQTQGLYRSTK